MPDLAAQPKRSKQRTSKPESSLDALNSTPTDAATWQRSLANDEQASRFPMRDNLDRISQTPLIESRQNKADAFALDQPSAFAPPKQGTRMGDVYA
jgi:hypothetical protein